MAQPDAGATLPPDPFVRHPKVDHRRGEPYENPAGLRTPSRTQFHGTVLVILGVSAALVAVVASFMLSGDRPSVTSEVVDSFNSGGRVKAIVKVVNKTDETVTVTCNVRATDISNAEIGEAVVRTGVLEPGGQQMLTAEFDSSAHPSKVTRTCNPAPVGQQ